MKAVVTRVWRRGTDPARVRLDVDVRPREVEALRWALALADGRLQVVVKRTPKRRRGAA